ncbi:MAG: hypothetical protein GVY19_06850 [Bacteroidetes bacterium]|nr:hypothetical protein [Bacteroidota bacterium]
MGFTTWRYAPNSEDQKNTYAFIGDHADIYSEHIDDHIPWNAWMQDSPLPSAFVQGIDSRVTHRIDDHELLVSVSLLNNSRDDLATDFDGSTPAYENFNDQTIEDAYLKHLQYIIEKLEPDYMLLAIEVNDLLINSPNKWEGFKLLMANIRTKIRDEYPDLQISESITLHNFYNPEVDNPEEFIQEINDYTMPMDFAAISFYPFFKGLHNQSQFQQAFDYLHSQVSMPIAFVETTHLAENLVVESYNLSIDSDHCEQQAYLNTLLHNAHQQKYKFIIWWAHRDFDALWETFPPEVKDLGKLWRDTGLLDEDGEERPAFDLWKMVLGI